LLVFVHLCSWPLALSHHRRLGSLAISPSRVRRVAVIPLISPFPRLCLCPTDHEPSPVTSDQTMMMGAKTVKKMIRNALNIY
jgi:hypothetical protein